MLNSNKILSCTHGKIVTERKWTVNASKVEWVECEQLNKTGTIVQLEAQIHQVICNLETLQKDKQNNLQQPESSLEHLTNKLSKEMNNQKFKLEPE